LAKTLVCLVVATVTATSAALLSCRVRYPYYCMFSFKPLTHEPSRRPVATGRRDGSCVRGFTYGMVMMTMYGHCALAVVVSFHFLDSWLCLHLISLIYTTFCLICTDAGFSVLAIYLFNHFLVLLSMHDDAYDNSHTACDDVIML